MDLCRLCVEGKAVKRPLSRGSGGSREAERMGVFGLRTPLAGGERKETVRSVERALEGGKECGGVGEIVW